MITVESNHVINTFISLLDDYEYYTRKFKIQHPYGIFCGSDTTYNEMINHIGEDKCIRAMSEIQFLFPNINLYRASRAVRKWYEKTNWEKSLSDVTVDKIITLFRR